MIYEYINLILGLVKVVLYKIFYFSRISFCSLPKMNWNFKIAIKKGSKLKIGKNFKTRNNMSFRIYNKGKVKIGNNCFFNDNCSINCQQNIEIGNNLICGPNVMFFDHEHDYKNYIYDFLRNDIKIGNNVWLGADCIILRGVTIGDNVVVAAGTIIRSNIDSNSVVYQRKETIIKQKKIGDK